jgi:uroporphyrinogen-III synthase
LRLLVLRPEPEASDTAARLRALGHQVLVAPMLTIAFASPPTETPPPGAIVFTSRNAVRAVRAWPEAAAWRAVPAFAVGSETAALAGAAGFSDVHAGRGDALLLAKTIATHLDPGIGEILYPAARETAADLDGRLRAAGFTLRRVEAYRAVAADRLPPEAGEALRKGAIDGALFFSRRTAATFARLVTDAGLAPSIAGLALYALSRPVAEPLQGLGGAIQIAAHPDSESLLALLPTG